jgi:hypothetical protein
LNGGFGGLKLKVSEIGQNFVMRAFSRQYKNPPLIAFPDQLTLLIMDVGNLKQPFGKSSKKNPLGHGLFKVGDYDEEATSGDAPESHGSFTERAKSEFAKVTGHHHKNAPAANNATVPNKD